MTNPSSSAAITSTIGLTQVAAPAHESFLQKVEHSFSGDAKKAITVMEAIGHDCLQGLSVVQTYLPAASALATAVFPADAAGIAGAVTVVDLIENSVATVEAKWTAGNESTKNGPQKLADVISLVEPAVTQLLSPLGIHANTAYVTKLVNVIVAILNVRTTAPAAA